MAVTSHKMNDSLCKARRRKAAVRKKKKKSPTENAATEGGRRRRKGSTCLICEKADFGRNIFRLC